MKKCKICQKEFQPLQKASKYCSDECRKAGHYQNKEKWRKQGTVKKRWAEYTNSWRKKNYIFSRFVQLRSSAKKRGITFDLIFEKIEIPERCPVLDIPLDGRDRDHQWSFDKLIPSLGYVEGNVRVISMKANRIKNNATLEELEKIYNYVKQNT